MMIIHDTPVISISSVIVPPEQHEQSLQLLVQGMQFICPVPAIDPRPPVIDPPPPFILRFVSPLISQSVYPTPDGYGVSHSSTPFQDGDAGSHFATISQGGDGRHSSTPSQDGDAGSHFATISQEGDGCHLSTPFQEGDGRPSTTALFRHRVEWGPGGGSHCVRVPPTTSGEAGTQKRRPLFEMDANGDIFILENTIGSQSSSLCGVSFQVSGKNGPHPAHPLQPFGGCPPIPEEASTLAGDSSAGSMGGTGTPSRASSDGSEPADLINGCEKSASPSPLSEPVNPVTDPTVGDQKSPNALDLIPLIPDSSEGNPTCRVGCLSTLVAPFKKRRYLIERLCRMPSFKKKIPYPKTLWATPHTPPYPPTIRADIRAELVFPVYPSMTHQ